MALVLVVVALGVLAVDVGVVFLFHVVVSASKNLINEKTKG